jgi:hypothetical protein
MLALVARPQTAIMKLIRFYSIMMLLHHNLKYYLFLCFHRTNVGVTSITGSRKTELGLSRAKALKPKTCQMTVKNEIKVSHSN